MQFKLGELFSGAGGLGLGAGKTQVPTQTAPLTIRHEWAVDYDFSRNKWDN